MKFPALIVKPALKTPVKELAFSALSNICLLQQYCNSAQSSGLLFSRICQETLIKLSHLAENINNSLPLNKMGKIGKPALAGALMLGAAVTGEPALAQAAEKQEAAKNAEFQVAFLAAKAKTRTELERCMDRRKAGEFGKGKEARKGYRACVRAANKKIISAQELKIADQQKELAKKKALLARLDAYIRDLGLRVNKDGFVINRQNMVIAEIEVFNGHMRIIREMNVKLSEIKKERARLRADTA